MKLYDFLKTIDFKDIDIGDKEIDCLGAFCYPDEISDNYAKLIDKIAKSLDVIYSDEDYCVCDISGWVENNLDVLKEIFDNTNYETEEDFFDDLVSVGFFQIVNGDITDSETDKLLNNTKEVKTEARKKDSVTEYVITFDDWKREDLYFDTKEEADEEFESLKRSGNIDKVNQYYAKTWVWSDSYEDYVEDTVDVYFTQGDEDSYFDDELDESCEVKTEASLKDRQKENIEYLKSKGYEEYQTGDKYTLITKPGDNGEVLGCMFYGNTVKPSWHYRFRSQEELEKHLEKFLASRGEREERMKQWKDSRKITKDHNIKVGDIYYTSWGYDQTNNEFYKVVAVRGSRIDLKEVAPKYLETDQPNCDKIVPGNEFVSDDVYTVSARADGTVTNLEGKDFLNLYKWNGNPLYPTDAYSGH